MDAVFNEKNIIGMVKDNTKCNALVHIVSQKFSSFRMSSFGRNGAEWN